MMKKILFTIILTAMTVAASAQVTFNVRAGFGAENARNGVDVGGCFLFQTNIPFSRGSHWTISPSVLANGDTNYTLAISVPIQFGYKCHLGKNSYFFPKIGPNFGYFQSLGTHIEGSGAIIGISADLAFEIKHFIVGITGYYSPWAIKVEDKDYGYLQEYVVYPFGAFLTLGYKF